MCRTGIISGSPRYRMNARWPRCLNALRVCWIRWLTDIFLGHRQAERVRIFSVPAGAILPGLFEVFLCQNGIASPEL